ncbi:uncharacterized protein METZ01_LOCUS153755, partial [marine metagenome]
MGSDSKNDLRTCRIQHQLQALKNENPELNHIEVFATVAIEALFQLPQLQPED